MFFNRMRYFNKRFLNRIMLKSAGYSRNSFGVVHHTGRRSGKTYETPIIVVPTGEGFLLALTYGPKVDWYRNLLAAGQGTLVWQGKTYTIGKPEPIDRAAALLNYPFYQRAILQLFAVQDFAHVRSSILESTRT